MSILLGLGRGMELLVGFTGIGGHDMIATEEVDHQSFEALNSSRFVSTNSCSKTILSVNSLCPSFLSYFRNCKLNVSSKIENSSKDILSLGVTK